MSNNDAIEQIKDRTDIFDVVSEHVALKKSGRNYWGCCPFHKEKTPSFSVNPEKGIYKCFGCGEGGDAISFLMKLNNQSFIEVIKELAAKYGIELPMFGMSPDKTDLKNKILEANAAAAKFYTQNLFSNTEAETAMKYLSARSINEANIKEFAIGYAPNQPDALYKHLTTEKKYDAELLEKAGLILEKSNKNGYVDRFRNRVIIPIFSEKGDVIAFGARALEENQNPKYLNSPETPVFSKSKTLYGLYQAINTIKTEDSVLIMEGYFDVITAHISGLKNVVASCGTSLTEQHLKILSRYTMSRKIYLAFDSDSAGQKATNRGAEVIKEALTGLGEIKQFDESYSNNAMNNNFVCEIRVVTTNSGKDPDEFIRTDGVDSYKKCIKSAPLLIDYQINSIMKTNKGNNSPQEKLNITKQIIPILAEIKNGIILDEYIKLVAQRLEVDHNSLKTEVRSINKGEKQSKSQLLANVKKSSKKHIFAQKNLLSLYFIDSEKLVYSNLNEMIKEVEFTEPNLIIIKSTIEQLSNEISNIKDLSDKLFSIFAENQEIKADLVDIIFSTEDKADLVDNRKLMQFIKETSNCIQAHFKTQQNDQLKTRYHNANTDEISSLQMQYEVREQIELNRQKLELINGQKKK